MARATGIGGVFLRSHDPKRLSEWYAKHLGIKVEPYGSTFLWSDEVAKGTGMTAWSIFPEDTQYFSPAQPHPLNRRTRSMIRALRLALRSR